ncbi:MAG: CoB--CoM heterodisulfide reductase iron-sulfur subunit B family protein [Magnetococcus sp. XQGC-1]
MSQSLVSVPYYPGCTMKMRAMEFERSAQACARALQFELDELPQWNCCGATYPLAGDNLMGLAGSTNVLLQVEKYCRSKNIAPQVVTLCAFCYNVLKRADYGLSHDKKRREAMNGFLQQSYQGPVRVMHYLEYLRDVVGFDRLAKMVVTDMSKIRVAPYYGCLLLKPHKEIGLDDPEEPVLMHDFLAAIGCQVVDFPGQVSCCGSYLVLREPEKVLSNSRAILNEAVEYGAHALVTTCPVCQSNLDQSQGTRFGEGLSPGSAGVPILYFTELLAVALGVSDKEQPFQDHRVDPRPILTAKVFASA